MTRKTLLVLALFALATPRAHAASLSVVTIANVRSIYLDGGAENGTFNTVIFKATPGLMIVTLVNAAGQAVGPVLNAAPGLDDPVGYLPFGNLSNGLTGNIPRPAGQPFTYYNRMLDGDPLDGGMGWSLVGVVRTSTELAFAGGPLGANISTSSQPGGRLFLANLYHIPEPASVSLAAAALAVLASRYSQRRSLQRL